MKKTMNKIGHKRYEIVFMVERKILHMQNENCLLCVSVNFQLFFKAKIVGRWTEVRIDYREFI